MCIISFIIGAIIMFIYISISESLKEDKNNKVHFYVARDKDKTLWLYLEKPARDENYESFTSNKPGCCIISGPCFKCIGLNIEDYKDLKWEDEPIEVFLNFEN